MYKVAMAGTDATGNKVLLFTQEHRDGIDKNNQEALLLAQELSDVPRFAAFQ
jgi:hypothetical protein